MGADMIVALLSVFVPTAWVGGYFWLADRRERREGQPSEDVQEVPLLLNGGYRPTRVSVMEGRPIFAFQSRATAPRSTLAVIRDGKKIIALENLEEAGMGELWGAYDLEGDPAEQEDLRARAWVAPMGSEHEDVLRIFLTPRVGTEETSLTAEELKKLEAMGDTGTTEKTPPRERPSERLIAPDGDDSADD